MMSRGVGQVSSGDLLAVLGDRNRSARRGQHDALDPGATCFATKKTGSVDMQFVHLSLIVGIAGDLPCEVIDLLGALNRPTDHFRRGDRAFDQLDAFLREFLGW